MRRRHETREEEQQAPAPDVERAEPQAESVPKELVEAALKERDEARDQVLRVMADFQNFKKRSEQEKVQLRHTASEELVIKLLPVLDNFERSLTSHDEGAPIESLIEGIRAVDRQFRAVLESVKVSRIPATGHPFDPELHEAIATVASDEHPEDTVVGEVESGYRMADRVIRPARVRVAKKP